MDMKTKYSPPIQGEWKEPKFIRPDLLTHPNIPKPLHGVNPRTLLGRSWWDKHRKEAYAKNNYCCWACGVHKSADKFHDWLEGHENYDIDYEIGRAELLEIVALCHTCHNFIHSGRLWIMVQKGQRMKRDAQYIMSYGLDVLKRNQITPIETSLFIFYMLEGYSQSQAEHFAIKLGESSDTTIAKWSDWHLVIDGEIHKTPYRDYHHWYDTYNK